MQLKDQTAGTVTSSLPVRTLPSHFSLLITDPCVNWLTCQFKLCVSLLQCSAMAWPVSDKYYLFAAYIWGSNFTVSS